MKNKLVALALSSVVLFGCSKSIDDFGDMNVNPNSTPIPVTSALLTNVLSGIGGTASYGLVYPEAAKKDAATQKIVAEWHTYMLQKCPAKFPEKGYAQITGPLYDKAMSQIAKIK